VIIFLQKTINRLIFLVETCISCKQGSILFSFLWYELDTSEGYLFDLYYFTFKYQIHTAEGNEV